MRDKNSNYSELVESLVLVGGSLTLGAFLVWIVTVDWVLEQLAWIILLAIFALGVYAGSRIYEALGEKTPRWVRITVATILGISIAITVGELTHSHKLIRYYNHYSSEYDKN